MVENVSEKEPIKAAEHSQASTDDPKKPVLEPHSEHTVLKDGLRLHPQPTTDPLDPLTWTSFRKHTLLGIVMFKYFMFTYITTTTVPSFPQLQDQYGISYAEVNWTVAIPALGLAIGPLIWSSPADIYGRRIVMLAGTLIAFAATIGAAEAPNYGGYMAARFFQGFGVSPAATVGLAVINDVFFEHERGQKVGCWVLAIDTGLLVGPIVGGFMNLVSAQWIQWLSAILFGILFILEIFFLPETLYPRQHMLNQLPIIAAEDKVRVDPEKLRSPASTVITIDLKRTTSLPYLNIKPVPGMPHPRVWDSVLRFILTFKFSAVIIAVLSYCLLWYWWILSVITMLPAAYPDYSPQIQGLLFIGLLLGTLFSEIFIGGRLSDYIVSKLARKANGVRLPEMRLWLAYPAGLLTAIGLIVWGISIDQGYRWIVGQVALFMFSAGIQAGNTVVCSYIVDAYPLQSMSVITFYSVCLNLSAFIDPFFIAPWQETSGWTWCFAAQGIIVAFGALPVVGLLHKFGHVLRRKSGQPSWVNPEFDTQYLRTEGLEA